MTELSIYYDFASPFCYIALEIVRRLQRDRQFHAEWLPFEVIDYLPERGAMPQNPAFVRRGEAARTAKLAHEYGLEIHLRERLLNSNVALCTVEHAKRVQAGAAIGDVVPGVVAALFEAYYRDGRDISDIGTVLDVAASVGLGGELEQILTEGRYRQQVAASRYAAHALGVVAVPTWLAGGYGVVGIPEYTEVERLLDTAAVPSAGQPVPTA
jgi:predicted DsbA family dithiol-disulfide isomerase